MVTIRFPDTGETFELSKASDVNSLLGGYVITVHKAQGSEWERVFLVLHASHITMCQRELLYTAVTRARSFLHIICEADTFMKGVKSQKVPGNTWKEKAEKFKGKLKDGEESKEATNAKKSGEVYVPRKFAPMTQDGRNRSYVDVPEEVVPYATESEVSKEVVQLMELEEQLSPRERALRKLAEIKAKQGRK